MRELFDTEVSCGFPLSVRQASATILWIVFFVSGSGDPDMPVSSTWLSALRVAAALVAVSMVGASLLPAEEPVEDPAAANADQLRRWIIDLSSEDFLKRREAAAQLAAQGRHAIEAVLEAARSEDRETASRCIDVLERMQKSDDEATRTEVAAALSALAESDDAALAQQARGLIEEPADVDDLQAANPAFRMPVRIQMLQRAAIPFDANGERRVEAREGDRRIEIIESNGGKIVVRTTRAGDDGDETSEVEAGSSAELKEKDAEAYLLYRKHVLQGGGPVVLNAQALAMGAVNQQVVVTNVDGERKIRVMDGATEIQIEDKDGKDIRMKVTREVNGQPMSTEYEADDLDDLKANHPDAAELYEKYGKAAPAFQIQALLNVAPGPGPRAAIGAGVPAAQDGTVNDRIEEALDSLEEVREQVQQLKAQEHADKDALEKLVQKLDEAEQRLFEAQSQLEE
jgi:hypothetical protein